jgi:hypothetical protein
VSGPILKSALEQIDRDLAALPPHVTTQLVIAADERGATIGWVTRTMHGWRLSAQVEQRWAKQLPDARVTMVKEWK